MSVFLVGMMGSGKSTLGRLLARRIGCRFIDADREVESRTGVKIPVIFELEGEDGFRVRETAALRQLVQGKSIVLATGGGAVLRPENRALLRSSGVVVYLHASVPVLHERTRRTQGRPLLAVDNPDQRLRELYLERDPLYREVSHLIVESEQGPTSLVLSRIMNGLEAFWQQTTNPSASS